MAKLRKLGVAVFFHEAGDVIEAAAAAKCALDRQRRDARKSDSVCVLSTGVEELRGQAL